MENEARYNQWKKETNGRIFKEVLKEVYEQKFKDTYNGKRLFTENNDLYLENLEGTNRVRLTNTPEVKEVRAFFKKDGEYVIFTTMDDNFDTKRYYLKTLKDNSPAVEISGDEFESYGKERRNSN